jgi:excisionase family DNA binding protein
MSELLTVAQVAETLKVSPFSVRRWVRDGQLPAVKLPRHVRICQADLTMWLEQRKQRQQRGETKHERQEEEA